MAFLPPRVAAELELNSVSPLPVTIEKEAQLNSQSLLTILRPINSTQSEAVIVKGHITLGTFPKETDYKA